MVDMKAGLTLQHITLMRTTRASEASSWQSINILGRTQAPWPPQLKQPYKTNNKVYIQSPT